MVDRARQQIPRFVFGLILSRRYLKRGIPRLSWRNFLEWNNNRVSGAFWEEGILSVRWGIQSRQRSSRDTLNFIKKATSIRNNWIYCKKVLPGRAEFFILGTLTFVLIEAFSIVEPGYTERVKESDVPDTSSPSLEQVKQGKALYEGVARCIHCHGQTALRRPLTSQELFSIIKNGVPGTSHMPFRYLLSDEEIWAIVHYQLHGLHEWL